MSRMDKIGAVISRSQKNIFYFISDEHDIIKQIINYNSDIIASRTNGIIPDGNIFKSNNPYDVLKDKSYIKDCHYLMNASAFLQTDTAEINKKAVFFIYQDFSSLSKPNQGVLLKQYIDYSSKHTSMLFITSPDLSLPLGYELNIEVIDVPHPDITDITEILMEEAKLHALSRHEKLDDEGIERINQAANEFRGLSIPEIKDVINELENIFGSFYGRSENQKKIGEIDNIKEIKAMRGKCISKVKTESAKKDPTITMLNPKDSIVGFYRYKSWLDKRADDFIHPDEAVKKGRKPIRGVLITGLPGTGKTQGAKYTAYKLNVPLVQLRIDNLLGGLVGDSERNFKHCRKRIEALAPCVVLIDEIEKLFSGENNGTGGNDVKMNIFTTLLDWMQENDKSIFFYATCNSAKDLKPELLRDGRFSMRFYIFMPTHDELVDMICFHMKEINDNSGHEVFKNVEGITHTDKDKIVQISPEAAKKFLEKITIESKKRNMLFTGANIETLLINVQYELNNGGKPESLDYYVNQMSKCAQSEFCQPYGETNLKDAVNFWLDARENAFSNAGGPKDIGATDELSFHNFTAEGEFEELTKTYEGYDKKLYDVFRDEITKEYKSRKK